MNNKASSLFNITAELLRIADTLQKIITIYCQPHLGT